MNRPILPLADHPDRQILTALAEGGLDHDVELRGYVRGHVMSCDECLESYAEAVAEANPLSGAAVSPGVYAWKLLSRLVASGNAAIEAAVGSLLSGVRDWADSLRYTGPRLAYGMGDQSTPGSAVEAALVPAPEGSSSVQVEVVEAPKLAGKEFSVAVRTTDRRAAGRVLRCRVFAGPGEYVAFDSEPLAERDGGYTARIVGHGLPEGEDLEIPAECVSYELIELDA